MNTKRQKKKKWLKRIIAVQVVFAALFFVVCNILVDVALVPEKMEQTDAFEDITEESMEALVHTDDIQENRIKASDETDAWVKQSLSKEWSLTTNDGYQLIGKVFFNEKRSHKWVLLLHGYTGWKEELYPIGHQYALQGYQVLAPDMRCSGESGGNFIGMGWTDRKDNLLWIQNILKQDPEAEIVIHGQSMGAAGALMLAGENLPSNVKAVVSDCAYTDVYSIFQKQIKEWFHLPGFPIIDGANLMLRMRGGYNIKDASAIQAVKKTKLPILFIHGDQDAFIPVKMAHELYEAANGDKKLLIVKGAGHAQSQDKNPARYYGTVFSFLEKYIENGSQKAL
ncbi:alpha/beta hydrolase [Blautia liquoris]|uniref:Alpha/beta hydrolase n=1 Tax=Blautia liquoris TaxID=2779518 RepID=A0A7M2RKB3_9FIRM|nr:alpha/beta hydrolase [Blautia liquoris]QOV20434.1 alpha/beta hydrolase [Blautia liquoris]